MNPVTQEYCVQCRFYEALAEYPYQLSSPAKQKCRHLERCQRVAELVKKTDHGQQLDRGRAYRQTLPHGCRCAGLRLRPARR